MLQQAAIASPVELVPREAAQLLEHPVPVLDPLARQPPRAAGQPRAPRTGHEPRAEADPRTLAAAAEVLQRPGSLACGGS